MNPQTKRILERGVRHQGPPVLPPFVDLPWLDTPYRGPELSFDFNRVAEKVRGAKALEEKFGCRFMMAVKSFADPRVLRFHAKHGIGFDISNRGELEAVTRAGAKPTSLSLTGPFLSSVFTAGLNPDELAGMHVNVDSLQQYEQVPRDLPIVLGMRINASSGSRSGSSRMGLMAAPREPLETIAKDPRFRGIHLHVNNDKRGYPAKIDAALTWLSRTGIEIEYLNLGGGLEHFDLDELEELIQTIRAMLPSGVQMQFEPGAFWTHGAGYARTRVLAVAEGYFPEAHKVTLDISRECHLRWTQVGLLQREHGWDGETEQVIFYGPTCMDGDIVSAAWLPRDSRGRLMIQADDELVFTHVRGYAAMWNQGFNGLPAATVKLVGLD